MWCFYPQLPCSVATEHPYLWHGPRAPQCPGSSCPHRGAATSACQQHWACGQGCKLAWDIKGNNIWTFLSTYMHLEWKQNLCWANVSERRGTLHKAVWRCPEHKGELRVKGEKCCPGGKFPIQTVVLTKVTKIEKLLWILKFLLAQDEKNFAKKMLIMRIFMWQVEYCCYLKDLCSCSEFQNLCWGRKITQKGGRGMDRKRMLNVFDI